ncbi:MAG: fibronectin type III domain-containing protein [Capnocytophaga sp.]|nr:fibronectin type III domain-containing protein [Capnocytophaga sp.]
MKKIIILTALGLFFQWSNAQNLITNGGFEDFEDAQNPRNWYKTSFFYTEPHSEDKKEGKRCLKAYLNGGSIATGTVGKPNIISVQGGHEYTLSYWYKGYTSSKNLEPALTYYNENGVQVGERVRLESEGVRILRNSDWQQKTITITVPKIASSMNLAFYIKGDFTSGVYILLDDVSLVYKGVGSSAPTGLKASAFQREIELSWDTLGDSSVSWEVEIEDNSGNKTTQVAQTNSLTMEKLEANTLYKVRIRSKKDGEYSDYSEVVTTRTQSFLEQENSPQRIPYLRTLTDYTAVLNNTFPKAIKLYYNDLYNKDAKISYFINGYAYDPIGSTLYFPKLGKNKLKIVIEEATDKKWIIQYDLNIIEK